MKSIYIFKIDCALRYDHIEKIRENLKQQISEGVVVVDTKTEFVGREIEIDGAKVTVQFIGENGDTI